MADGAHPEPVTVRSRVERLGLWLGPLAALLVIFAGRLDSDEPATGRMAAVAIWMALWWITEAVPLAVTALLPVVLFPLLGIMAGKQVAPLYFNSIIFLFLGGFLVALAMERWELHRRIALRIILLVGGGPWRLVCGFMVASAFLSMWISNTATTMMMVPIAMAVVSRVSEAQPHDEALRFSAALLLGTAYGASLGGIATLVGTPPNPMFIQNLTVLFPQAPEISFARWLAFALPLSLVFLLLAWLVLGLFFRLSSLGFTVDREIFRQEHAQLGSLESG